MINDVVSKALIRLETILKDDNARVSIEESMFESAIIGLSKGEMTYENDVLLPMILESIK